MKNCFICVLLLLGLGAWCDSFTAEIRLGSDILADRGFRDLDGKRVGLLTNPGGVNRDGVSTVELLWKAPNVNLVALFGAEHGVYGDILAGKEFPDSIDRKTGLPIFSLYGPGPVREPTPKMLQHIDILVYDLQDTGARSYTFITTMGKAMAECGRAGVDFMVLDRPNPLGGLRVEGPHYNPRFRSLVGYWPIPYVYGMTCGELARMIKGERMNDHTCRLLVLTMKGWRRSMVWDDTGLDWVPTSPNVPYGRSPMYQVATGMLGEIGGVDIGIHTKRPFEYIAIDWLKAPKTASYLNGLGLPGIRFHASKVVSQRDGLRGRLVPSVEIVFRDPATAPLSVINFYLLDAVNRVSGRDLFQAALDRGKDWRMFDKVNGTDATRRDLQAGRSVSSIAKSWEAEVRRFKARRQRYLIYQ
ncbi:MAG: hypothetical protein M2R45_00370 [Verrucomicrobia subdivision 3 bacterium]|nr:hypothetical protein [Limisphaerales bacterium]MCS1412872.1 hypothetical protein [Limisphaerales bacterium]